MKMLEEHEVVAQMFSESNKHGEPSKFNCKKYFDADTGEKLKIILEAENHILGLEDGKERFTQEVNLLLKAFALSVPDPKALDIKAEVGFFQAVKSRINKFEREGTRSSIEIETAIKQIVDKAVVVDGIIDIFDAAGIKKPDISILSDEFLAEIKGMKHRNLALELLKKLLNNEISNRRKKNLTQSKKFSDMLAEVINKYRNNLLTAAQVIEELIQIAREIRASDEKSEEMGLSNDEIAFYDALAENESAVEVMKDDTLRELARILVENVQKNTTIDWQMRESAKAKLRTIVRRLLSRYGYPPDQQQLAIDRIMKQTELMADNWVNSP